MKRLNLSCNHIFKLKHAARFFRVTSRRQLLYPLLLTLALYGQCRLLFFPSDAAVANARFELHQAVLKGGAPRPYQYQMFLPSLFLQAVLPHQAASSPLAFSKLYSHFYAAVFLIGVLLLFRLCCRVASPLPAALVAFYLILFAPIIWIESFYHPSDPIGLALTVLIMESLLDGKIRLGSICGWLLLSGLFWEKNFLLPLVLAGYQWRKKARVRQIFTDSILMLLAVTCGQAMTRFYFGDSAWLKSSVSENIATVSLNFLMSFSVLFVPPIVGWIVTRPKPPLYSALLAQWPLWMFIYVLAGTTLSEMRAFLVMIPYTYPIFAQALNRAIPSPTGSLTSATSS